MFFLLGCLLVIGSAVDSDTPFLIGSILFTTLFGWIMIYFFRALKKSKPVFMISTEGIIDRTTFMSPGLIPWEEINSISYKKMSGQLFLSIQTKDKHFIIDQTTGIKKFLHKINKSFSSGQVNIPVQNLAYDHVQLHNDLQTAWKENIAKRKTKRLGS